MNTKPLMEKLAEYGLCTKAAYNAEAFSRNFGLISSHEQETISNSRIAIPGMGGVGGVHLITMARTGIGKFNISDFDIFEPANINRQFGAKVNTFGKNKLDVMEEQALQVNPYLKINKFLEGINKTNIDAFLEDVDIIIDAIDFFEFETRRMIFNKAREKGIYVITAGPIGFSSAMLIFSPYKGMGFDEYFDIFSEMTLNEKYIAFAIGLTPRPAHLKYMNMSKIDLENKAGPSLGLACQICSGMAAAEVLRIILNKKKIKPAPYFFQFDPFTQKYQKGKLYMGNKNPVQILKRKIAFKRFLDKKPQTPIHAPAFPKQTKTDKISESEIDYILQAGIMAPSGDNAQPWKFSFQNSKIDLYINPLADKSFFNVFQKASLISLGAVIENMKLAAKSLSITSNITYKNTKGYNAPFATIDLVRKNINPDSLANFIWKRNTNRKLYNKIPLNNSVISDFNIAIKEFPKAKLQIITDKDKLKKLARLIYLVDTIRCEHRPLFEHLNKMIRFTQKEAEEKKDGLPLKNLEAGKPGELFLKACRSWRVMNMLNHTGLGKMISLVSYQGITSAAAAALLFVDENKNQDFIYGGRALERIWLTATQKGISFQPMTAITLFWTRWQQEAGKNFSEKHNNLLNNLWTQYSSIFKKVDFSKNGHIMLFRIGYADNISCRTRRKDLKNFMI